MRAILLCGGFATRLWPVTSSRPKPLLPVGNKPLLAHIIDLIPSNIPITISTNEAFAKDFQDFAATVSDRELEVFVEESDNDAKKRGALGGVYDATQGRVDDFIAIGGDNFFDFSVADFITEAELHAEDPLIAVYDCGSRKQASKFGVVEEKDGIVKGFEEKPDIAKSSLIGTFLYYIPKNALPDLKEAATIYPDKAGALFIHFLEKGHTCRTFTFDGYWNDIGSFLDYLDVHRYVSSSQSSSVGNVFDGSVYVSEDAIIEHSTIKNSIVLGDAKILNSHIEDCVIDAGSILEGVHLYRQAVTEGTKLILSYDQK
jgi:glucose-1-phosphate thymidylyltransferase